jgi:hypothetical protein
MASASAASLRQDFPTRKPVASEALSDVQPTPLVRQAFGADVVRSSLSPRAQLGYRVLVDHVNRGRDPRRPYDGRVFMTDETFAVELGGVSKRQAQRIRAELLAGGWICLPNGDAGGRGNSTIWYHLHPDGRPCPLSAETPLKQRGAAEQANARRASARTQNRSVVQKDDNGVIVCGSISQKDDMGVIVSGPIAEKDDSTVVLSAGPGVEKDDTDVVVSAKRMTESAVKDDKNDAKDDRIDSAYKEELIHELIPELKSTTTATGMSEEFPPEFARLMDEKIVLDDGALRRLWQQARAIVPDASAKEVWHFFSERAMAVYRNRKLENPTGLMLSTVRDWFPARRVQERRIEIKKAEEESAKIQSEIAQHLAELRAETAGRDGFAKNLSSRGNA